MPCDTLVTRGVQFDIRLHEPATNTAFVCDEIADAAVECRTRLVVFPEAALTGYVFESLDEALAGAISATGPELLAIADVCRSANTWTIVGAIERADGSVYNSAFLVGPDGIKGKYRKVHTLCLGVDRFAQRGDEFLVWDLPIGRIGLNICYDATFPESSRTLKLLGAQLIVLPTNWPMLHMKQQQTQMRAYENHVNYLAVNRVGEERGTVFPGGSMAVGPRGELLVEAGAGPERIDVEFDMAASDRNRVVLSPGEYEFDYVADRRPDMYRPVTDHAQSGEPTGSVEPKA
jgi:predicted amidohydrolase